MSSWFNYLKTYNCYLFRHRQQLFFQFDTKYAGISIRISISCRNFPYQKQSEFEIFTICSYQIWNSTTRLFYIFLIWTIVASASPNKIIPTIAFPNVSQTPICNELYCKLSKKGRHKFDFFLLDIF